MAEAVCNLGLCLPPRPLLFPQVTYPSGPVNETNTGPTLTDLTFWEVGNISDGDKFHGEKRSRVRDTESDRAGGLFDIGGQGRSL